MDTIDKVPPSSPLPVKSGKKTVSDRTAKARCREYLESQGYDRVGPGEHNDSDLLAWRGDRKCFFEVKYSSKASGRFFGTVMLTELYAAVIHPNDYFFIVCRGRNEAPAAEWFFQVFTAAEFIKYCSLTTPIFHYQMDFDAAGLLREPHRGAKSVPASVELTQRMWSDFCTWKGLGPAERTKGSVGP